MTLPFPVIAVGGNAPAVLRFLHAAGSLLEPGRAAILAAYHRTGDHDFDPAEVLPPGFRTRRAANGLALDPGVIYYPHRSDDWEVRDERLRVLTPDRGPHPNLDRLMASAADACGPGAAGVVLSGLGRDGVQGLLEIRRRNGLALAEDPACADPPALVMNAVAAQAPHATAEGASLVRRLSEWLSEGLATAESRRR